MSVHTSMFWTVAEPKEHVSDYHKKSKEEMDEIFFYIHIFLPRTRMLLLQKSSIQSFLLHQSKFERKKIIIEMEDSGGKLPLRFIFVMIVKLFHEILNAHGSGDVTVHYHY